MTKNEKQFKLTVPAHSIGARVLKTKRHPNGDITSALQHWKKTLKESGNLQKLKDRKEHEKKSVTRRREINKAKYIASLQDNY